MRNTRPEPDPSPTQQPEAISVVRMVFAVLVGLIGTLATILVAGFGLQWAMFMAWAASSAADQGTAWGAAIVAILAVAAALAAAFGCARLTVKVCRKLLPGRQ